MWKVQLPKNAVIHLCSVFFLHSLCIDALCLDSCFPLVKLKQCFETAYMRKKKKRREKRHVPDILIKIKVDVVGFSLQLGLINTVMVSDCLSCHVKLS